MLLSLAWLVKQMAVSQTAAKASTTISLPMLRGIVEQHNLD
jgi:hypothetical protein